MESAGPASGIREILPKAGLVYSEKGNLGEVLSKPKIMPIKVRVLQQEERYWRPLILVTPFMLVRLHVSFPEYYVREAGAART